MDKFNLKSLLTVAVNDIAQRLLSGNKWCQKRQLNRLLRSQFFPRGSLALDFGCGSGLFAPLFARHGFAYTGFDVDGPTLAFAKWLYPKAHFTQSLDDVARIRSCGLILAHCCFHHIPSDELHALLERFKTMLAPDGIFLLVDILAIPNDLSPTHRWFMTLEQGQHVRTRGENEEIIGAHFRILRSGVYRDNLFAIPFGRVPIGNDLLFLVCAP